MRHPVITEDGTAAPAVSVIIPAFHVHGFIAAALDSVLAQTFSDFEIIVVDDGSPDREEIEDAIRQRVGRILHLKQDNGGPASARNAAVRAATGRFLAFLDSDDQWEPGYLAEQVGFLTASTPNLQFVYTDAWIEGDPLIVGRSYMEFYPSNGDVNLESLLSERCRVITSAVVVSRDVVLRAGLFDESLRYAEDLDLWLRIAKQGARMGFHRKPLMRRRTHPGNTGADAMKLFDGVQRAFNKLAGDGSLSAAERAALTFAQTRINGQISLMRGKRGLADRDFKTAIAELSRVDLAFRSWKATLAIYALRVAPRVVYTAYSMRQRVERYRLARVAATQPVPRPAEPPASAPNASPDAELSPSSGTPALQGQSVREVSTREAT
ncbi:MAG: glycosyltransferase family 2 protein [Gemmatimonadaceae bacterium]